jgi:hypothetical protein
MILNELDADDRLLARSVFGTEDEQAIHKMILDWAQLHGLGVGRISCIELSIGAAVTINCPNGGALFVKVWPGTADPATLTLQMQVQSILAGEGYPAPAIFTQLLPLGPGWAVAMEFNRSGSPTDVRVPGTRRAMATGLARLVALAEPLQGVIDLPTRGLPPAPAVWPKPHNALFDFHATSKGAAWIDTYARDALSVMRRAKSRMVLGHHDWSAKNMRVHMGEIAVVYDWDSVFLDREAFIVGSAAAHFPLTWELDVPEIPTACDVSAFVSEYEEARDTPFSLSELTEIEAAATYARAYKARCEHAIDPDSMNWSASSRENLHANGPLRLKPRAALK